MSTVSFSPDTFAADTKAFRSAAVTSENKATPFARSLLAGLVSGGLTVSLATSAIIHAFGNPKGKNGKVIDKLSALRNSTGGDAVRKSAEDAFGIFANIDVDAPRQSEEGEWVGAGAIRPLVVAFILNDKDAPKSLKALKDGVAAAVKAHAAATMGDNSEATEQAAADAAPVTPTEAPVSLADRINVLSVAIGAASDDDLSAVYDAFDAMVKAYDARINAATDAAMPLAA